MSCPEKVGLGQGCPVADIVTMEDRYNHSVATEFYETGGKLDDLLAEEQLARERVQNPDLPGFLREQEQRHLAQLEAQRIEQTRTIETQGRPRFDIQRLQAACLEGCTVEYLDTEERWGDYRICGSLALNETQRYQEVLPALPSDGGPASDS